MEGDWRAEERRGGKGIAGSPDSSPGCTGARIVSAHLPCYVASTGIALTPMTNSHAVLAYLHDCSVCRMSREPV